MCEGVASNLSILEILYDPLDRPFNVHIQRTTTGIIIIKGPGARAVVCHFQSGMQFLEMNLLNNEYRLGSTNIYIEADEIIGD
jgi:hypothetical protein